MAIELHCTLYTVSSKYILLFVIEYQFWDFRIFETIALDMLAIRRARVQKPEEACGAEFDIVGLVVGTADLV